MLSGGKKVGAKKTGTKKVASKKVAVKRAGAKKVAVKKVAVKRAGAKKVASKKVTSTGKKCTTKKCTTKKCTTKRVGGGTKCTKNNHPSSKCEKNPNTGRWINKKGDTAYALAHKGKSSLKQAGEAYGRGKGEYAKVDKKYFCGPAGRAPMGTFPVDKQSRCHAALSYARYAPYPKGIAECALRIARKEGWKCGTSSNLVRKYDLRPSNGKRNNTR